MSGEGKAQGCAFLHLPAEVWTSPLHTCRQLCNAGFALWRSGKCERLGRAEAAQCVVTLAREGAQQALLEG